MQGGSLYLVGGAVRDSFLGIKSSDEDYSVVNIDEAEFLNLFPNAYSRGKSFKVFDIEGKEFALARKEIKRGIGHKEFEIITDKNITIEEDLQRRDITINAIAKDVLTDEIIDPYNGIDDLKNGIIRATSEKFKEDPLRVYRAARFAALFNFKIDKKTLKMMEELREELDSLSKERVFVEFRKALETKKPSIFFEVLKEANVLDVHFREIYDLIGAVQPQKYHPEGDSYNHTLLTLDNSAKITKNTEYRFAALVHDLGKGRTPKEMYPHHYGHEQAGVEPLIELCRRIGVPVTWRKCGKTSVLEHMRGGAFKELTPAKKVSFLERVDKSVLGLEGLQIVVYADRCRFGEKKIENEEYNFVKIGKKMLSKIDGKYIEEKYGIKPGIEFGRRLHQERVRWMKENMKK